MGERPKIVIIAGAGATYSDAVDLFRVGMPPMRKGMPDSWPEANMPPLNAKFFQGARESGDYHEEISDIGEYMREHHGGIAVEKAGLEKVMTKIYTDTRKFSGKPRGEKAEAVFSELFSVLTHRIADTTNDMNVTNGGNYGRIINHYLGAGCAPEDITVITFNYDLQIEKAVNALTRHGRPLNFPYCYDGMPSEFYEAKPRGITGKTRAFKRGARESKGISVLKLHGSLNWLANSHASKIHEGMINLPSRISLMSDGFDIARRKIQRTPQGYTLPAIVPPVGNRKEEMLHSLFTPIWGKAEHALETAKEVVIFGYSCPSEDKKSGQLIQGAFGNNRIEKISVIDPLNITYTTYSGMARARGRLDALPHYKNAADFLLTRK